MLYDLIFNGRLAELKIFDMTNVEKTWDKWQKNQMNDYQSILKIAQLEILRDKYCLRRDEDNNKILVSSPLLRQLASVRISVEYGLKDSKLMKYLLHRIKR